MLGFVGMIWDTPGQKAAWQQKIAPVVHDWAKMTPDGDKVLAAFRERLAAVKAGR